MTKEELNKLIDHEINWLSYYATRESRSKLNENSDIYKDLVSIGYTKRIIPLDRRCSCGVLTANTQITKNTSIDEVRMTDNVRNVSENRYSPLETYLILFPEEKITIFERLNIY